MYPGPRFSKGLEEKFKIKTCWIVAQFLGHKPVDFASLTDSFIVSLSKLLNFDLEFKHGKHKKAFAGPEKLSGLSRNRPQSSTHFWEVESLHIMH